MQSRARHASIRISLEERKEACLREHVNSLPLILNLPSLPPLWLRTIFICSVSHPSPPLTPTPPPMPSNTINWMVHGYKTPLDIYNLTLFAWCSCTNSVCTVKFKGNLLWESPMAHFLALLAQEKLSLVMAHISMYFKVNFLIAIDFKM